MARALIVGVSGVLFLISRMRALEESIYGG